MARIKYKKECHNRSFFVADFINTFDTLPMTNADLVSHFYQILLNLEVSEIIVCAGARNAPLVVGLEGRSFKVESYFEERSTGFYALGKMRATNKPVVVITTSGTAVAELLPAVIEAHYQSLPLIVVSADRPKKYRGSGAPQAIEQVDIFKNYVQKIYDWDVQQTDFKISYDFKRPIHFNLCFDEPLIDGDFRQLTKKIVEVDILESAKPTKIDIAYDEKAKLFKNPLIIVSQLSQVERSIVKSCIKKYQVYHYAEALSGLLGDPEICHLQINSCEPLFNKLIDNNVFTSVVRIGGVPTLRLWRDLEHKYLKLPVLSASDSLFSGLSRESLQTSFDITEDLLKAVEYRKLDFSSLDQQLKSGKNQILNDNKDSEQNYVKGLSQIIQNQPVYLGNSLPIREWDMFAQGAHCETYGNRGANGIDGQLSTYIGWSNQFDMSWAVVGDLTTMYDLAALGLAQNANPSSQKNIVVINNCGGQIFKKVFNHEKFLNPHKVQFKGWAEMFGWNYMLVSKFSELTLIQNIRDRKELKNFVIEIQTNQTQSDLVWQKLDELCKATPF